MPDIIYRGGEGIAIDVPQAFCDDLFDRNYIYWCEMCNAFHPRDGSEALVVEHCNRNFPASLIQEQESEDVTNRSPDLGSTQWAYEVEEQEGEWYDPISGATYTTTYTSGVTQPRQRRITLAMTVDQAYWLGNLLSLLNNNTALHFERRLSEKLRAATGSWPEYDSLGQGDVEEYLYSDREDYDPELGLAYEV